MLNTVIGWARNVKLSLESWSLLSLAALLGGLLIAFKLQGSRLHEAQVKLLELTLSNQEDAEDSKVASLRSAAEAARKAYDATK